MSVIEISGHGSFADADDARIPSILSLVTEEEFLSLTANLQRLFGLTYNEVERHPFNIKTIICGKDITFSRGVSATSKMFMVLHSLGHYYFISEAKRKAVERYAYIYDLRGVQAALHYYETAGKPNGLDKPPQMTEERRKDRISFEVSANKFAADLLRHIGFRRGLEVLQTYEAGDIDYILDVSHGGKAAIVPTDTIYVDQYVSKGRAINPDDAYDNGVYDAEAFRIDAIDWRYIQDIKLEIHLGSRPSKRFGPCFVGRAMTQREKA